MMTTTKLIERLTKYRKALSAIRNDGELPLLLSSSPCLAREFAEAAENFGFALGDAIEVLTNDAVEVTEGGDV